MIRRLKPGVRLGLLQPQMVLVFLIVGDVYAKHGCDECVVTSANDSKHGPTTLHDAGRALDFRTKTITDAQTKADIVTEVKACLGPDFDVVLEGLGTDNEHMHVEYDPK